MVYDRNFLWYMTETLGLEEIMVKKSEVEEKIKTILSEFIEETGLMIDQINIVSKYWPKVECKITI